MSSQHWMECLYHEAALVVLVGATQGRMYVVMIYLIYIRTLTTATPRGSFQVLCLVALL